MPDTGSTQFLLKDLRLVEKVSSRGSSPHREAVVFRSPFALVDGVTVGNVVPPTAPLAWISGCHQEPEEPWTAPDVIRPPTHLGGVIFECLAFCRSPATEHLSVTVHETLLRLADRGELAEVVERDPLALRQRRRVTVLGLSAPCLDDLGVLVVVDGETAQRVGGHTAPAFP